LSALSITTLSPQAIIPSQIFANLLDVIMRAPMSYFDTTPVGRIVNRFSQDMYTIDSQLMAALRSYLTTIMSVCSTVVVISGVTPAFAICLIPIFLFYASQQKFFTVSVIVQCFVKLGASHKKTSLGKSSAPS
jgi:ABC-type multidrug transport system fused ATPase/permease subunit